MSLINKQTLRTVYKRVQSSLFNKAGQIQTRPLPIQEDIATGVLNTLGKTINGVENLATHVSPSMAEFGHRVLDVFF